MRKNLKSLVVVLVLNAVLVLITLLLLLKGSTVLQIFNVDDTGGVLGEYVTNLLGVLLGGILGVVLAVFADRISRYLDEVKEKQEEYNLAKRVLANDFCAQQSLMRAEIIKNELEGHELLKEYVDLHGLLPRDCDTSLLSFEDRCRYLNVINDFSDDFSEEEIERVKDFYTDPNYTNRVFTENLKSFRTELKSAIAMVERGYDFAFNFDFDRIKKFCQYNEKGLQDYFDALWFTATKFRGVLVDRFKQNNYSFSEEDELFYLLNREVIMSRSNVDKLYMGLPCNVSAKGETFESWKNKYIREVFLSNTDLVYDHDLPVQGKCEDDNEVQKKIREFIRSVVNVKRYDELAKNRWSTMVSPKDTEPMGNLIDYAEDEVNKMLRYCLTEDHSDFVNEDVRNVIAGSNWSAEESTVEEEVRYFIEHTQITLDSFREKLQLLTKYKVGEDNNLAQVIFRCLCFVQGTRSVLTPAFNLAAQSIEFRYKTLIEFEEVITKSDSLTQDTNNRFSKEFEGVLATISKFNT